jgi:putative endonuclease
VNLRHWLGARGERQAARFLRRRGYRILCRNYVCPLGEIDLVAQDGDTTVFVEVKTRTESPEAQPEHPVSSVQRRRVQRAALSFSRRYRLEDAPARFDVVLVTWSGRGVWGRASVEHFEDAFPLGG